VGTTDQIDFCVGKTVIVPCVLTTSFDEITNSVVVSIMTVTVPVGTDEGKTVEMAGSLITVGIAEIVTVVKKVGTGVDHELAGTETTFELGK
jgi:hypothetical protein